MKPEYVEESKRAALEYAKCYVTEKRDEAVELIVRAGVVLAEIERLLSEEPTK